MPLIKKIETPVGLLGIWQLSESSKKLLENFVFSKIEKAEFFIRTTENRKKEYLASRLLLHKLFGEKTCIIYTKTGQPKLKNKNQQISISHSADFLGILISNKEVGLDIENTNRTVERIEKRFLCQEELKFVEKTENPALAKVVCWSAKEAIFKCTTETGIQFNKQIFLKPFNLKKNGEIFASLKIAGSTTSFRLHYFFLKKNVVIYCAKI